MLVRESPGWPQPSPASVLFGLGGIADGWYLGWYALRTLATRSAHWVGELVGVVDGQVDLARL